MMSSSVEAASEATAERGAQVSQVCEQDGDVTGLNIDGEFGPLETLLTDAQSRPPFHPCRGSGFDRIHAPHFDIMIWLWLVEPARSPSSE
jgi:hypothetical protein